MPHHGTSYSQPQGQAHTQINTHIHINIQTLADRNNYKKSGTHWPVQLCIPNKLNHKPQAMQGVCEENKNELEEK